MQLCCELLRLLTQAFLQILSNAESGFNRLRRILGANGIGGISMWYTTRTSVACAAILASAVIWPEAEAKPTPKNDAFVEVAPASTLLRTAQLHSLSGAALRSISVGY